MRVLVAGGKGFIGRHVVQLAQKRGHDVVVSGRGDTDVLARDGFDAVIWSAGGRVPDVEQGLEVHARAPARTLQASGATRFVYLGSGECYGLQDVPFREDMTLKGTSPYARAKIAGEEAVAEAALNFGAAVFLLRPAVVFGAGQKGQMLVPALLNALRQRRHFPMTAGEQTRDVIHVDDVARLIVRCLDEDAQPDAYNVGTGTETPVIDVVTRVVAEASRVLGADLMPLLEAGAIPYRDGEQMRYVMDVSRTQERLGWKAEVPLDDGIERTVASFLGKGPRPDAD
jgi:nucleoside-diphosphate-sugar epimerase